jgi:hypothetical protein
MSETPIHDQLAIDMFRAELDRFDDIAAAWS